MITEEFFHNLTEIQSKSENKCGTTIIYLSKMLNISQNEIKEHLKQLYDNKLIIVRKGINNQLIFLRKYDSNKR